MECGVLPSMICARSTPRRTASTQQSIFGNHAAADDAVALQLRHVADVYDRDKRVSSLLIPQQTDNVGHQNEFARAELRRNARRRHIGVDVVHLTVVACGTVEITGV